MNRLILTAIDEDADGRVYAYALRFLAFMLVVWGTSIRTARLDRPGCKRADTALEPSEPRAYRHRCPTQGSVMPYTHCPSCNLHVYAPRSSHSVLHHCPRCETVLQSASLPITIFPSRSNRVRAQPHLIAAAAGSRHE